MIEYLLNLKKFIPNEYHNSIYDVDYNQLYANGYRIILTDLDNTLISYDEKYPNEKLFSWKHDVEKIGFRVIIISNSRKRRVQRFAKMFENIDFQHLATKPLKRGYNKVLKRYCINRDEVVFLGDQLMTDIFGAKRVKIYAILIEAIKRKTEKFTTRFNRRIEIRILKRIKRKHTDLYKANLGKYAGDNYGI